MKTKTILELQVGDSAVVTVEQAGPCDYVVCACFLGFDGDSKQFTNKAKAIAEAKQWAKDMRESETQISFS